MDKFDIKILEQLQKDASLSVSDISKQIGLSVTPCWRRINILEEKGVISKRVALLNRQKLNLNLTVIASVKTTHHDRDWLEKFVDIINNIPEIIEFYRMSGDIDYLLKVVVPSIDAYDVIYKRLIELDGLSDVSSSFAMEDLKYTTELPLRYTLKK